MTLVKLIFNSLVVWAGVFGAPAGGRDGTWFPSCRAGWRTCSTAGLLARGTAKHAHTMTECGTGGRMLSTSWRQRRIGLLSLAHQTSQLTCFRQVIALSLTDTHVAVLCHHLFPVC